MKKEALYIVGGLGVLALGALYLRNKKDSYFSADGGDLEAKIQSLTAETSSISTSLSAKKTALQDKQNALSSAKVDMTTRYNEATNTNVGNTASRNQSAVAYNNLKDVVIPQLNADILQISRDISELSSSLSEKQTRLNDYIGMLEAERRRVAQRVSELSAPEIAKAKAEQDRLSRLANDAQSKLDQTVKKTSQRQGLGAKENVNS